MSRLADGLSHYLDRLARQPDLPGTAPAHFGGRRPVDLFVERDVEVQDGGAAGEEIVVTTFGWHTIEKVEAK